MHIGGSLLRGLTAVTLLAAVCGTTWAIEEDAGETQAAGIRVARRVSPVIIEAWFFTADAETLRQQGLLDDGDTLTMSSADLHDLLKKAHADEVPGLSILCEPTMTVLSGQRAYVMMTSQTNYVRDYQVDPERGRLTPVMGTLQEGLTLELRPAAHRDGSVVYHSLTPHTSKMLGMRDCRATVEHQGRRYDASWQEPVMLVGRPRYANPCDIRMKAGEALVVPLDYAVEQGAGEPRASAVGGKVKEVYEPAVDPKKDNPAGRITVCVLAAEVLAPIRIDGDNELEQVRTPEDDEAPVEVAMLDALMSSREPRIELKEAH